MNALLKLAFPVVLTYLGMMSMGFVDLLLVGRVNAAAIGAVGIGTSVFSWFMVIGIGMASGLEYLVSHAHGAKERDRQHHYLVQGVWLSIVAAIPLTLGFEILCFHLNWFGINAEVIGPARDYAVVLGISLVLSYLFAVFRLYITAMGIARPPMFALVMGNLLNAGLGYVLVLGHLGVSPMGAVGSAWATVVARLAMVFGLGIYIYFWDKKNGQCLSRLGFRYDPKAMRELVRIGMPAGLQMLFEMGVFALSTTLAGRLTAREVAAHQIVLNAASLTFMVPLGVGSATAVLVAQSLGKRDVVTAIRTGWTGFGLGIGFMALSSMMFLLYADPILGVFTKDPQVIALGKSILFVAALFQLSDGTQAVGTGALRGLGDTHSAMYFNLCGHWLIGLPVGITLCFYRGWGLQGLWIGLSLGLTAVAVANFARWWMKTHSISQLIPKTTEKTVVGSS